MSDPINHREFLDWVTANYDSDAAELCRKRLEKTPADSPYAILHEVLDERCPAPSGTLAEVGDFRFNS